MRLLSAKKGQLLLSLRSYPLLAAQRSKAAFSSPGKRQPSFQLSGSLTLFSTRVASPTELKVSEQQQPSVTCTFEVGCLIPYVSVPMLPTPSHTKNVDSARKTYGPPNLVAIADLASMLPEPPSDVTRTKAANPGEMKD